MAKITLFDTPEEAYAHGVKESGLDPYTLLSEQDDSVGAHLDLSWTLDVNDLDPRYEACLAEARASQKGYKLTDGKGGDVHLVLNKFGDKWFANVLY